MIAPGGFEPPLQAPKACVLDRYTTGLWYLLCVSADLFFIQNQLYYIYLSFMYKFYMEGEAAGFVVFYGKKTPEFLLLHSSRWGYWGFPKGWVENENLIEAAFREVFEETGLRPKLVPGFHEVIDYTYSDNDRQIHKRVHYFLGRVASKKVVLSGEHDDYCWVLFKEALSLLTYDTDKCVLKKANEFLSKILA